VFVSPENAHHHRDASIAKRPNGLLEAGYRLSTGLDFFKTQIVQPKAYSNCPEPHSDRPVTSSREKLSVHSALQDRRTRTVPPDTYFDSVENRDFGEQSIYRRISVGEALLGEQAIGHIRR